jgi:hypothetical protein
MQYKTIVLEFLQEYHPLLHEQLRTSHQLLPTLNAYAQELKAKHNAWMEVLRPRRPHSDPSQIASEALELALEDLHQTLQHESSADASQPLSLDAAIAFIRRHTPPA